MDAFEVLVVVLSVALAVLLLIAILCLIQLYKVLKNFKRISLKAEALVDNAETVATFFKKTAAPVALTRLFGNIIESIKESKAEKRKGRNSKD